MLNVTRPWLPERKKLDKYIDRIYQSGHITNNGPLLHELEQRLTDFLGVKHLIMVSNGTLALQVAYEALDLRGDVITTPFSFVATASSLKWQKLTPVFSDINKHSFNLEPCSIEQAITDNTSAIVPVHVFGNPCDTENIERVAKKHNLPIIYDAAHAFGVKRKGVNVLNSGDISTISFHATKLFHTIEGGAIVTNSDELAEKVKLMIRCGIPGEDRVSLVGINAKVSEFSAAMGLCVLDDIDWIMERRSALRLLYEAFLNGWVGFQQWDDSDSNNSAYMPVLLPDETVLTGLKTLLIKRGINPRRYFYPSLDSLNFLASGNYCPVSRNIASRILCLPLYPSLKKDEVRYICDTIKEFLHAKNQAS